MSNLEDIQNKFINHWGTLGSSWGVNRTMTQIHALLMVSKEPITTDFVMERLKISRGNAHSNLKELVSWGIARQEIVHAIHPDRQSACSHIAALRLFPCREPLSDFHHHSFPVTVFHPMDCHHKHSNVRDACKDGPRNQVDDKAGCHVSGGNRADDKRTDTISNRAGNQRPKQHGTRDAVSPSLGFPRKNEMTHAQ